MTKAYDFTIIGAGIIGLTLARTIKEKFPDASVLIIEKESEVGAHASGRNSGVLHAGFYYSADSFKARFTVAGNIALKEFCAKKQIPVNACGKLVVAGNEEEHQTLYELERRGKANGSNVRIIPLEEAREIEPNVVSYKEALYSPDTASVDPLQVCLAMKDDCLASGIELQLNTRYLGREGDRILTSQGDIECKKLINCAGLYADRIAHQFGFGKKYTMIPFKGLYLKYTKNKDDVRINIYPVPNLKNPFLGVHFTKAVDGTIKIGPTAIPAFWRENYGGFEHFDLGELGDIVTQEAVLFFKNSFHFRDLAFEEMRKYNKRYFIGLAQKMVQSIDPEGFTTYTAPGIRAQLLDKEKSYLVQDFCVEADDKSVHILNAVSPALTCAIPFSHYILENYLSQGS